MEDYERVETSMNPYYSQHGEDFLLNEIFKGKKNGYYVEVGCLDGIEFSNTFFFEKLGWSGACIEAHNDFIGQLRTNRPHAQVIHCAVGETEKAEVIFYANKGGSLSTLDKSEESRWRKYYEKDFFGFEEQRVPMRSMTSIFEEIKPPAIDFVSLDIEGYEVHALKGLDLNRFKPLIFIIEYKNETHKANLDRILMPHGYTLISKLGGNLLYSLDPSHKKIVNAKYGLVDLVRVGPDGKELHHQVKLSPQTLLDRIRKLSYWLRAKTSTFRPRSR